MANDKLLIWSLAAVVLLIALYVMLPGAEDETETTVATGPVSVPEETESRREADPAPEPVPQPLPVTEPAPEAENMIGEEPQVSEATETTRNVISDSEPAPEPSEPAEPEPESMPSLNNSDDYIRMRFADVDGGVLLLPLLTADEIIRKFVIMVENLRQGDVPARNLPVTRPDAPIQVRELGDGRYLMEEASYQRFTRMINAFAAVNSAQAVVVYRDLQPLFQEAYGEIGYPDRDFTAAMIEVIDSVLEARTAEGPFVLVRPNVMYQYEDPAIESFSDVEKLLLRIGPDNAERLKQKLRVFRDRLAGAP